MQSQSKTLVVNMMGEPDAGKSTMAAAVFAELKFRGIRSELALEYAKDRVWEGSQAVLHDQIYVFGKQWHRTYRLLGKVRVIVTDSPLWLSILYDRTSNTALRDMVVQASQSFPSLTYFLERTGRVYDGAGRLQTEDEAKHLRERLTDIMLDNGIKYEVLQSTRGNAILIADRIEARLGELGI